VALAHERPSPQVGARRCPQASPQWASVDLPMGGHPWGLCLQVPPTLAGLATSDLSRGTMPTGGPYHRRSLLQAAWP
ncbi:hypothetical protein B296_00028257, partial [Ensete ventricosum]